MKQELLTAVHRQLESHKTIIRSDLIDLLGSYFPQVKKSTLEWRIYELIQTGLLSRLGRGVYTLNRHPTLKPTLTPQLQKTAELIHQTTPFISYCVWDTRLLHEFLIHQPLVSYGVVEVEKPATQIVLRAIEEAVRNQQFPPIHVYLEEDWIRRHPYSYAGSETLLIIKALISEAPLQVVEGYPTITLEKILVDLAADPKLYSSYQEELPGLFSTAFERYTVNLDKLRRYARRRNKAEIIDGLLRQADSNL